MLYLLDLLANSYLFLKILQQIIPADMKLSCAFKQKVTQHKRLLVSMPIEDF